MSGLVGKWIGVWGKGFLSLTQKPNYLVRQSCVLNRGSNHAESKWIEVFQYPLLALNFINASEKRDKTHCLPKHILNHSKQASYASNWK